MSETNSREIRTYLAYILALVGSVTLVGTLGFHHFEAGTNPNVKTPFDSLWWAMVTITTIGYGDIYPVTMGGRIFALFLMFTGIGVLSVSTAGIAAYLVKFDQIEQLRTLGLNDHVVICGLGKMGFLLAGAFRREGHRVVVIERDEGNEFISTCRQAGVVVLVGNAAAPETLMRAKLHRAKHLIIVCGHDSRNAEVAAHAHAATAERADKLECSVQVMDPDLWHLLRSWDLATPRSFRLDFFNVFDLGARAMLAQVPPFPTMTSPGGAAAERDPDGQRPPHLLVLGATNLAQHLVVNAVRAWREQAGSDGPRFRLTLLDSDIEGAHASLHQRYPGLERVVDLAVHAVNLRSFDFHHGRFLLDEHGKHSVTRVYVCLDDEAQALSAGLALLGRLRGTSVPVVVRMDQEVGLALLLNVVRNRAGFGNLHVFGVLEHACQPDLVTGGSNEILARALHDEYLRSQRALGSDARGNPAMVAWDDLPRNLQELNRSQADDISAKLEAIDYWIGPLLDFETPAPSFTADEVERLAIMEHERWLAERRALGWSLGPRDEAKKTNPNLLPWDQLGDDARTVTREMVRQLPALLARTGLTVSRNPA